MQRLATLTLAFSLAAPAADAQDQPYPTHTVRMLAPAAPGGNPDVLARLLADKFTAMFGKPFVVENVPGAGGVVAAKQVVKSPPDGQTLLLGDSGALAIGPALSADVGYDPIKDLTGITALASVPTILVANPRVPAATLAELVALARKEPGKLSYGSAGPGSIHHLTMAMFAKRAGIDLLHVPYRGGSAMVNGLLAGDIDVGWSGIPNVMALIESGKLRAYCISVLKRSPSMPAVPTCDELGQRGFDVATTIGLQSAAGTPAGIVGRLQSAAASAMREPAMANRMRDLGLVLEEDGTAHYAVHLKEEAIRFATAVRELNLQASQ
jgi:tripartite-type tricarboxylate transporter receptor subunit TctC